MPGAPKRATSCAGALLLLACHATLGQAAGDAPALEKSAPRQTSRSDALGEATLSVHGPQGLLVLGFTPRGAARATMPEKAERWLPLLRGELGREPRTAYRVAAGEYPELGARLAVAAAASDRWDAGAGRPRAGSAEAFAAELLASPALFEELASLFRRVGYALAVDHVEGVVLCSAGELPASALAPPPALPVAGRFPCGASVWFRARAQPAS